MSLSADQIEIIALEAAEKAAQKVVMSPEEIAEVVHQTLLRMGVDSNNPLESQKDFQHLRQWRKAGEDLRNKGMLALMTIFVTGLVSLVIVGLKDYLK